MKKQLETAWMGPQFRWGSVSGNHYGMANSVRQDDRVSDMALPAVSVGKVSEKEQLHLPAYWSGIKLPLQLSH